jgi:hypothetical protein
MWALYTLRILIVLALADISLRYVELPIRRGAITFWIKGLKYRTRKERTQQTRIFSALFAVVLVLASIVSVRAIAIGNEESAAVKRALTAPAPIPNEAAPDGLWVTGDSVILGIRAALGELHPISLINARIGRQAPELLDVMLHDKSQVQKSAVVFDLGNNNALTSNEVKAIFEVVKDQPKIIVVNTAVPRPYRDANNAVIAEISTQYPRVSLVDWNAISAGHPEYFAPDGVHLVPAGVAAYVAAISQHLI